MSLLIMKLLTKMWLALPHPHWTFDVWEHLPKSEEPKCSTGLLLTLLTRLAFPTVYLSQIFLLRVWWWTLFIMQWDTLHLPMLLQLVPTDEHRHWEPWENGTDLWYSPASQTGERVEQPVDSRSQQPLMVPLLIRFSYVTCEKRRSTRV